MKNRYLLYALCILLCACCRSQQQEEDSLSILLPNSSEYIVLIPSGLDTSQFIIRDFYEGHGLVVSGFYYMLFEDSVPQYYHFPFECQYTDIAWYRGNCYIAKDSLLIYVEDNGKEHIILRTDGVIKKIFPTQDGIYFAGDSILSFFRFSIAEAEPITQFKACIHDIYPLDENICFVAVESNIIQINKGEAFRVHSDSLKINSIEITPKGLFFATDNYVCYLSSNGYSFPIVEQGARQLIRLEDNLYIIYNDNSCAIITNISNYNKFTQNVQNYEMEDTIR